MTLQSIRHIHPLHGFTNAIERLKGNIADHRKAKAAYDKTYRELSAMSQWELTDIGIDRADISLVAAEAASMV